MNALSIGEVEYIAYRLATEWFDQAEPIPEFATRYPDKLESCLVQPFTSFNDFEPYPTLEHKAAILFYLIIKNHPFLNGNKRLAVTILLNFLAKNGKWLNISPYDLYEIARGVAASKPQQQELFVSSVIEFIQDYLTDFRTK